MKMSYHQVPPNASESFRVIEITGCHHACTWHFHPEYQLSIVLEGAGHRIIGDNIAPLELGEVSLLGPNLPHAWQFEPPSTAQQKIHAIIVYFKEDSFGSDFFRRPEAQRILRLLNRSTAGLQVLGRSGRQIAAELKALPTTEGFQRVLAFLGILHRFALSEEVVAICSSGFVPQGPDKDGERLRKICELIQHRLAEPLRRSEVARQAHFSPGAFSRFFKARTGKTFHEFVGELRVGRACRLLGEQELNVTEIASACGYANVTSFNRVFRRTKKASPTEYRRKLLALN
jgi:AraC-like DNA-binding protein